MNRDPLEKAENEARNIARILKKNMPVGFGFTLILYSYGGPGVMTYLSSGDRDGCIKMMRECADKIENNNDEI